MVDVRDSAQLLTNWCPRLSLRLAPQHVKSHAGRPVTPSVCKSLGSFGETHTQKRTGELPFSFPLSFPSLSEFPRITSLTTPSL